MENCFAMPLGAIEDFTEVKAYTIQLANELAQRKRKFIKLVMIGVGPEVSESQMEELDDLDYGGLKDPDGHTIDLWDYKMASTMQKVEEIFAEVVTADTILAPSASITDSHGAQVSPIGRGSYGDGLPALLEFTMPASSKSFTLNLPNTSAITQPIA
jgi:hypothetical protein